MQTDTENHVAPGQEWPRLMMQYQRGDATAMIVLVEALSPQLYRFFVSQTGNRADAEAMLEDAWRRIHRARHTYRPGESLLPWIYAIVRRVRADNDRKNQRIASEHLPPFERLIARLPERQREVLTMLKLNGLSIEEVARATSSTVGAAKQKARRACERLRRLKELTSRRRIT